MLLNIIIGTLIPWLICFALFMKFPAIILLMFPLGITIAFLANDWGMGIYWTVTPIYSHQSLSVIPYYLGYFPMLTSLFATVKFKTNFPDIKLSLFFATLTTSLELLAISVDKIHYYNGWNIGYTMFVYLGGFMFTGWYMKMLIKYKIL